MSSLADRLAEQLTQAKREGFVVAAVACSPRTRDSLYHEADQPWLGGFHVLRDLPDDIFVLVPAQTIRAQIWPFTDAVSVAIERTTALLEAGMITRNEARERLDAIAEGRL